MAYDQTGPTDDPATHLDTVLLLHAGVADRRMWEPQLAALAVGHRVVRADLRGFGDTPMPGGPFSYAADVRELLDELGARRVGLVGSSVGGRVALEVAATDSRVVALVLLAPAAPGYAPTEAVRAFGAAEDALLEAGDVDGATDLNVRTWTGPEASDAARELVRTMQRRAFEVQLAADALADPPQAVWAETDPATITARTTVAVGAHDLDHFQAVAADLADRIPGAQLVRLGWAGHLPSLERPADATALVLAGLAPA